MSGTALESLIRQTPAARLNLAPWATGGIAVHGVVRQGTLQVRCDWETPAESALALIGPDGRVEAQALSLNGAGSDATLPWPDDLPLASVWVMVRGAGAGELLRLPMDEKGYHLHRLLAHDMDSINRHLRWKGRIEDFETRAFAAWQSYAALQARLEPAAYCLVSIGYTALERDDPVVTRRMVRTLSQLFDERLGELRREPRISFLTHLLHYAIHFRDFKLFERVADAHAASLEDIEQAPTAAANAMVVLLLSGSYYFTLGRRNKALEIFNLGDRIFRLAAQGYPRDLVKYRELTEVCSHAFLCRIGAEASRGGALRPDMGIQMFDPITTARDVCRLKVPAARARLVGPAGPDDPGQDCAATGCPRRRQGLTWP